MNTGAIEISGKPRVPAKNLEAIGPAEFWKEYVDLCTLHSPGQGMFPITIIINLTTIG
jgi:hypothetical protein